MGATALRPGFPQFRLSASFLRSDDFAWAQPPPLRNGFAAATIPSPWGNMHILRFTNQLFHVKSMYKACYLTEQFRKKPKKANCDFIIACKIRNVIKMKALL